MGVPTLPIFSPSGRSPHPAIVFLGQNPGSEEDAANEPFLGRSGRIVRRAAASLLLSSSTPFTCYLSNTARCYTRPESPPTNRQYSTCIPHFLADLRSILLAHTRCAVVALGAPACTHLRRALGTPSISLKKGFQDNGISLLLPTLPTHPFTFFTTYHPAYLLRSPGAAHPFSDHLSLVSRWLSGTLPVPSSPSIVPPFSPFSPSGPSVPVPLPSESPHVLHQVQPSPHPPSVL